MQPQENREEGELLVVAMTRPAMIGGLTLNSLVFSVFIPSMVALTFKSPWLFLGILPCLGISYVICLKDVYRFEIIMAGMHLSPCPNKKYWGCRRYAPK